MYRIQASQATFRAGCSSTRTNWLRDLPAATISRALSITSLSPIHMLRLIARKRSKAGAAAKRFANPHWYDLAEHWTEVYKPDNAEEDPRQIPHPAEGRRASG